MIAKAGKYFSKSNNSKNHQWYHINLISSLTLSHKRSTLNFVYKQNLGKYCFTRSCSLKNPIHHPKRKKKFLTLVNVRYYTGDCKTNKQTNKHAREIKRTTTCTWPSCGWLQLWMVRGDEVWKASFQGRE